MITYKEFIEEAINLKKLARKYIPGEGKRQAKEKSFDRGFDGHMYKAASVAKRDGKLLHPDHEDLARTARVQFKASRKFKKIAEK